MSENPFTPGTLDHTQWIIGYQWGSDRPAPNKPELFRSAFALFRRRRS